MATPLTVSAGGTVSERRSTSRSSGELRSSSATRRLHEQHERFPGQRTGAIDPVWAVSWEDDLVMTNVRSFDVKAYDNAFGGYADLGWGTTCVCTFRTRTSRASILQGLL